MQLRGATSHHHPLPVEGRPQPTRLRSVARTARKPPRPARRASLTAMPAAPAVCCSRLGPASSACVLLSAQVSRLRRLPFTAVRGSPGRRRCRRWKGRPPCGGSPRQPSPASASDALPCISPPVKLVSSLTVDSRGTSQRHGKGGAVWLIGQKVCLGRTCVLIPLI